MTRKPAIFRWLLSSLALATIAFLCAGTTKLPMLGAYIAMNVGLNLIMALVVDPALLDERSNPGNNVLDPFVGRGASLLFLVTVVIAALDSGRFHWSRDIGWSLQASALALLAFITVLQIWSMAVNPFFSTEIRLQAERGHRLVSRGPYRFVRHPGYFAMIFAVPATAIAIGSYIALIPALLYSAVILRRTLREDTFLKDELPDYLGYTGRVRYKLLPGLW